MLYGREVLGNQEEAAGLVRVVSYKPLAPKKRKFPPPLFEGRVKWGDRLVKNPQIAAVDVDSGTHGARDHASECVFAPDPGGEG